MPAKSVYGFAIGDTFLHPAEGIVQLEKFELTGPSASPWVATLSCQSGHADIQVPAKELKELEKRC